MSATTVHGSNKRRKFIVLDNKPLHAQSKRWPYPDYPTLNKHLEFADECHIFKGDFTAETRLLKPDAPREKYRRRYNEGKSAIHWGQRKLLLSEIEFLSLYGHLGSLVVYAGAAGGRHCNYLAKLFPNHMFHLYDPRPFSCHETENIKLFSGDSTGWFTDETAQSYATDPRGVLFISDIRTANWRQMSEDEVEIRVVCDNNTQRRWVELMQPRKCMLKFKCSYRPGKTEYFDGDIQLPIWGPATTTETRLIPFDNSTMKVYDNTHYEEQMFYFNTKTRMTWYPHSIQADGICHCFDCRSEIYVLGLYLDTIKKQKNIIDNTTQECNTTIVPMMSEEISTCLGSPLSCYVHRVPLVEEENKETERRSAW